MKIRGVALIVALVSALLFAWLWAPGCAEKIVGKPSRILVTSAFKAQASNVDSFVLDISGSGVAPIRQQMEWDSGGLEATVYEIPAGIDLVFAISGIADDGRTVYQGASEPVGISAGRTDPIDVLIEPVAPMLHLLPLFRKVPLGGTGLFDVCIANIPDLDAISVELSLQPPGRLIIGSIAPASDLDPAATVTSEMTLGSAAITVRADAGNGAATLVDEDGDGHLVTLEIGTHGDAVPADKQGTLPEAYLILAINELGFIGEPPAAADSIFVDRALVELDESGDPPVCEVTPARLGFGEVVVGGSQSLPLTVRNAGAGTLIGYLDLDCEVFDLDGDSGYRLTAGESTQFTVVFAPDAVGPAACALDAGPACGAIPCSGDGIPAGAVCVVAPTELVFGQVGVNYSADLDFIVTNLGSTVLAGSIIACPPQFSIVGDSDYSLAYTESDTFTVRFAPTAAGPITCTIETGSGQCLDVAGSGEGILVDPVCTVEAEQLDFGSVPVDGLAELDFTIRNDGGGLLTGEVHEGCWQFEVISDDGTLTYELGEGEAEVFTVRYTPQTAGSATCVIETRNSPCDDLTFQGYGEPTNCSVSPLVLEFGEVGIGYAQNREITITNSGGGLLSGSVSACAPDFEIIGEAAYSLTFGQSDTFTVRFSPTTTGPLSCVIDTGTDLCSDVSGNGTGLHIDPLCEVLADTTDFGDVPVGGEEYIVFTIRNAGGGTLNGEVSLACPTFTVIPAEGDFSYSLTEGEQKSYAVRFAPVAAGAATCVIETGSAICGDITFRGFGVPPTCVVDPTELLFGEVALNGSADLTFTITNSGGGVLAGNVTACPPHFTVIGDASYSLTHARTDTITIRFSPDTEAPFACDVLTGQDQCAAVACSGSGALLDPICEIIAPDLGFGGVPVGGQADLNFTVRNVGGGTLTGAVSESCDEYSIIPESGDLTYSLLRNAIKIFTVRFAPTAPGNSTCQIDTGSELCADLQFEGYAGPPSCGVRPESLDFGAVGVGQFLDRIFTVTNTGSGILAGSVSACPPIFEILENSIYTLAHDESDTFTIRFAPTAALPYECTIETGSNLCVDIDCVGEGDFLEPICQVSTDRLDFGTVEQGEQEQLNFSITNTGGGVLTGNVSELCNDFRVESQDGSLSYSLAEGETELFTVYFSAAVPGSTSCIIETGSDLCSDVLAVGFVEEDDLTCIVYPDTLYFGCISTGDQTSRNMTIKNLGATTLLGRVETSPCPDFHLSEGIVPWYILAPGDSIVFPFVFEPLSPGTHGCFVDPNTSSDICGDVLCFGIGNPSAGLINGNFEIGDVGWVFDLPAGPFWDGGVTSFDGTPQPCAEITGSEDGIGCLRQQFDCGSAGDPGWALLTLDYELENHGAVANTGRVRVFVDDELQFTSPATIGSLEWSPIQIVVDQLGSHEVSLCLEISGNNSWVAHFDNVNIECMPPTR